MKRSFLVILLVVTCSMNAMTASGQDSQESFPILISPRGVADEITVTETSLTGLVLEARPSTLRARTRTLPEGRFLELYRPAGTTTTIGLPALPALGTLVDIPYGARNVSVEIVQETWNDYRISDVTDAEFVLPLQPSVPKIEGALENAEFVMNEAAYQQNSFSAGPTVQVREAGIMRAHRLMHVTFHPVQYNPALGMLRLCSHIVFKINYQDADQEATERILQRYESPFFNQLLEKNVAGFGPGSSNRAIPLPIGYLIVTHTSLAADIQALADWKEHIGFTVTVATTAETGSTANEIKDYIEIAYNTWPVPPTFVLLVGDTPDLPSFTGSATGYISDLEYSLMNTGDYFPDIFIGRFSVASTAQLQNVLDKVLGYEQVDWAYTAWIKKAVFMASVDNYQISEGTHNHVIDNYLDPAGYLCDKLYQVTYGATTQDVRDSLNDGRSLAVFSGHGSSTSWADGPSFSQTDVNNLTNLDMYPFVCSHACNTGNFSYGECFAETWQRAPGKGGLVFWGSAPSSYWDEDDIQEKGMFKAAFGDGIYFTTGMTNEGLLAVYNYYSGGGKSEYYYQAYHVFGDPSLFLHTEEPLAMDVTHDEAINVGSAQIAVSVLLDGSPVENALVHAAKEGEVFVSVYTDATGSATIPVSTTTPGNMDLVVTAHNGIPYEGTVIVFVPSGPYVVLNDYTVDDSVGGNNDGDVDINEAIALPVAGKNVGVATAYDVTATLDTLDPMVTITDGTETFGDIGPDATVWSADDFDFEVSDLCEDGHVIPFTVTFDDNASNSWSYGLNLLVSAPDLVYDSYALDDVIGNGDGIADPGETVHFDVVLLNDGHHVAENVSVTIHTSDTYCDITTPSSAYVDIDPGNTASNLTTLSADISAATPVGHEVVVNVDVYRNGNLCGTGQFPFVVSKIPILIVDLDENHNSAPAMEAALAVLDVAYETTQSWPSDTSLYSSMFICLGIYSDNTELSQAQANALVAYMQNGGDVYMEGGDCWYYDDYADVYADDFGIDGLQDGSDDTGTIQGQMGTFAEGLTFWYNGDNGYMDHIGPLSGANLIFENLNPSYGNGVAYDAGDYQSVGVSFEFGGLTNGPGGNKRDLMCRILEFMGITKTGTLSADQSTISVGAGGVVNFFLNAGAENGGRTYCLLAGASGSTPGTTLPDGTVLPLNRDSVTSLVMVLWNTPYCVDFVGTLDAMGEAGATFDTLGPLPGGGVGAILTFAYACPYVNPSGWFASNSVDVALVP